VGVPSTLFLDSRLLTQIFAHARADAPREAVGIVGGTPDGHATRTIPLPNIAGPQAFLADPVAQYHALRELKRDGLQLIAIYHSHPGGGTNLSVADQVFAARWNCLHLVVVPERAQEDPCAIRAWSVTPSGAVEVQIELTDVQ